MMLHYFRYSHKPQKRTAAIRLQRTFHRFYYGTADKMMNYAHYAREAMHEIY